MTITQKLINSRCFSHGVQYGFGCPTPCRCFYRRTMSRLAWAIIRSIH